MNYRHRAVGLGAAALIVLSACVAARGSQEASPGVTGRHSHPEQAHAGPAHGHSHPAAPAIYVAGAIRVEAPWSRATPGGAKVAGGFMRITNIGTEPDRLLGGSAEIAQRVEIHESSVQGGVARMRPIADGLTVGPGETLEFRPGGYHVMFIGLARPLTEGEAFEGTLVFEKAGPIEIEYRVLAIGARTDDGGHRH